MNERTVFMTALEKEDLAQRRKYLDEACAGNLVLRDRIESLLRSHERAGKFLDVPAPEQLSPECKAREEMLILGDDGKSLDFLTPTEKPGSLGRLGHYDIQEVVGKGGMGIVLKAFDEKLHRVVAIKVMAAPLATTATARQRFAREAQAAAAVSHDHIVTIHAVEEASSLPYLVMQYVSGQSLQERIDLDGPLEIPEILRIGMQTASALAAAHAQGLVHRDIKPANILLENGIERVKITDFGLARVAADAGLTQTGIVAGTPHYMSPEQAEGKPIDQRTDLFSLGSVLYAMCTGFAPFRASGSMAVLRRVCDEPARPVREVNPQIPDWLAAIEDKLHAKNPADRFQSAAEVAELLGKHLAHLQQPTLVPMPSAVVAGSPDLATKRHGRETVPQQTMRSRRWLIAAGVIGVLLGGMGLTEATGITRLTATVIRILTPDGMLVVEVDDPDIKVTVDADGGLVITGAGLHEIRLHPGSYRLQAMKDGKPIQTEIVTIMRGQKQVVKVNWEGSSTPLPRGHNRFFVGHVAEVWSVSFTPDDRRIVSAAADSTVRIWNAETGKELKCLQAHDPCVYTTAISPDGRWVLAGNRKTPMGTTQAEAPWSLSLWELETGKELHSTEGKGGGITSVVFSKDGRQALIANFNGTILLWNVVAWNEIKRFDAEGGIWSVCFSPDGHKVLVGGGRNHKSNIRLFDLESGTNLRTIEGPEEGCWQAIFSPDGRHIYSAGLDDAVRVWDLETGALIRRIPTGTQSPGLAFSKDGRYLLIANSPTTGMVRWLNLETGEDEQIFQGHTRGVRCIAISHDGRRVVSGSQDKTVRTWGLASPARATPEKMK